MTTITNNCATKWPKPVWRRWVSAGHSNWNLAMRAQNLMGIVFYVILVLPIRKTKGKHMKTMKIGWQASCYRISWLYLFDCYWFYCFHTWGVLLKCVPCQKGREPGGKATHRHVWTRHEHGAWIYVPSWELKYTLPRHFWRWLSFLGRVGYVSLPKLGDGHNKWQSDCDTMCWHRAYAAPSRGIQYTDLYALPKAKLIVTHSYNQIPAVTGTQILWGSDPWPLDPPGHPNCFKDMFP